MSSMITATAWVPRGHAAAFPTKYNMDDEEYARIAKLAKLELDDARHELAEARHALSKEDRSDSGESGGGGGGGDDDDDNDTARDGDDGDDGLAEYDMDGYDHEPDGAGDDDGQPTGGIFGNIKSLAYHADNSHDPYLTLPDAGQASDDEEREELQILPTDNLVLAARIEDEVAHLEVYVYEDEADNLYVHHDVMLPAVPLCVEWVGTKVGGGGGGGDDAGEGGSFAAVGTMDPEIELWDLDTVDGIYPHAVLGQPAPAPGAAKKKKKKKSTRANAAHHVDSVLALAANRAHRNLLASASADTTVKLWDLTTCTAAHSYAHHTDKVCALAWHPAQTSVLLCGSYDRTAAAADMRAPATAPPRWGVESDVEQVRWDPHHDHLLYVSTERGVLHCFDARQAPATPDASAPVWRLQAHAQPLSCLALNPAVPGFLATASTDRTVKLWDVTPAGPRMVVSRDLDVGKVFAAHFAPDPPVAFRLAVAGSKAALRVWDTSTNKAVREAFAARLTLPRADVAERLVAVQPDDDDDDDDDRAEAEAEEHGGAGGWESMDEDEHDHDDD